MAKVLNVHQIHTPDNDSYPFMIGEFIAPLTKAIKMADEQRAHVIIDQFIHQYIKEESLHHPPVIQISIELWTVIAYSLHLMNIKLDDVVKDNFHLYSDLQHIQSSSELAEYFHRLIHHVFQKRFPEETSRHHQITKKVIIYVEKNIGENITLQEIAEQLHISRNYLGRIFRGIVGMSFNEYVKQVRMERALKMLRQGDYYVYEVSEKVGYVNPTYFSTVFKEYTGMTPTDLVHKNIK